MSVGVVWAPCLIRTNVASVYTARKRSTAGSDGRAGCVRCLGMVLRVWFERKRMTRGKVCTRLVRSLGCGMR